MTEIKVKHDDGEVETYNHGRVMVITPDGHEEVVEACCIEPQDVNEDGTVSTPVSGECECFNDAPTRKLFTDTDPTRKP